MATKAQLEARVVELERHLANDLAVIDGLADARDLRGVRIIGEWTNSQWTILVVGKGIRHEDGMKMAGIFRHSLEMCRYVMLNGTDGLSKGDDEDTVPADGRGENGGE